MFDSLRANPVRIVGDIAGCERRDERDRPAGADEQRPHPEHLLERVEPEEHGRRVGGDQPGGRRRQGRDLHLGAVRGGVAEQRLERQYDPGWILVADEPDRTFASASTAITVFWRTGEPPRIPCTSTEGSAQVRR